MVAKTFGGVCGQRQLGVARAHQLEEVLQSATEAEEDSVSSLA